MSAKKSTEQQELQHENNHQIESKEKQTCGIVMPISAIDGCDESHWSEVRSIISDPIEKLGFTANLVSNADDVGIIQKRIIQNLYDNPIVVCDVSGKNPNVMFELGMRLAFDKPTVIIKDDKTSYSFDTSIIEHLEYPRDLRFSKIIEFKKDLLKKIDATYKKSIQNGGEYTTFLKHFGEFKPAKVDQKELPTLEYLTNEIRSIGYNIDNMRKLFLTNKNQTIMTHYLLEVNNCSESDVEKIFSSLKNALAQELQSIETITGYGAYNTLALDIGLKRYVPISSMKKILEHALPEKSHKISHLDK